MAMIELPMARKQFSEPLPFQFEAEKYTINEDKDGAREQGKQEIEDESNGVVLDIDTHADGCGDEADQSFRDTVDADGVMGESIFKESHGCAHGGALAGAAAGQGRSKR